MMSFCIIDLVLVSLCLISVATKGITESKAFRFVYDEHCSIISINSSRLLTSLPVQSIVDCARSCSQDERCHGIRNLSDGKGISQCQFFTSSSSNELQKSASVEPLSHEDSAQCYKLKQNISSSISRPDLHRSNWITFVDTNDPQTLTESHIKNGENFKSGAKCVVLASSGVYYAFEIFFNNRNTRGTLTNIIEKDNHGFLNNSRRIMYSCTTSGTFSESVIDLDGKSRRMRSISVQQLRIILQKTSIDTLQPDLNKNGANDLISWLKKGFNIFRYQYAVLSEERSAVLMYSINKYIEVVADAGGRHKIPLTYRQSMLKFKGHFYVMRKKLGVADRGYNLEKLDYPSISISLSSLWMFINSDSMDIDGHIMTLSQFMSGGHRFRVGFNNSFFDVHDVWQANNNMYFILPQQITTSENLIFTPRSVGVRAAVSTRGTYTSCSHPIEGDGNLGTDVQTGLIVQHFVDKKAWMPVFSVFSDGTSVFGNPADVADEVLLGKDLNVLIKWLHEDKSRLLTITMTTIKDYGQPNISINAESVVSWHLINTWGSMELSSQCNLEKVLMKSNGEVDILVYNTVHREPVFSVLNIQTTWFVY